MTPPANALYGWYGLNDQLFMLINGYHWPALDVFALAVTSIAHPNLYPFYVAAALAGAGVVPNHFRLRT